MKIKPTFREKVKILKSLDEITLKKPFPSFIVFFKPDNYVENISQVNIEALKKVGVKWLIINVNIKDPHDARVHKLINWLSEVKKIDMKVLLLTNRTERSVGKTLSNLGISVDAILSKVFKPFVWRRKKLFSIVGNIREAYMISNDFIFDTSAANVLGIETTIIEENFLKVRWIDKKYHRYQRQIVTFFLRRKNMINTYEDFRVGENQYDEFL